MWIRFRNRDGVTRPHSRRGLRGYLSSSSAGGPPVSALLSNRTTRGRALAAWLVTVAFIVPIYIALVRAFKSQSQILSNPPGPPVPFPWENIGNALYRPDALVQTGLLNSIVVTVAPLLVLILRDGPA